ncbi:hypothetical protein ACFIJ5_04620 [Haloimpatiens sp. FM7330]|uniref:hypothetical protein n=1 Tax=Haloimpatiens sp. FM7330 TaxID=3298610 RepID=UPI0036301C9E
MKLGENIIHKKNSYLYDIMLRQNGKLIYSIRDVDNKELCIEKEIGVEVKEFAVDINLKGNMCVLFMDNNSLKFCECLDKELRVNKLYTFDRKAYNMKNINLKLNKNINLFFELYGKNLNEKNIISHYKWDGNDVNIKNVCSLSNDNMLEKNYKIYSSGEENLYLFYIQNMKKYCSLRLCQYKKEKWEKEVELFKIGKGILNYDIIQYDGKIEIVLLGKSKSIYKILYVEIDNMLKISNKKEYETVNEIINPFIFIKDKVKVIMWIENNNIICDNLEDNIFKCKKLMENINREKIDICNYISNNKIISNKLVLTKNDNIQVLIPNTLYNKETYNDNEDTIRRLKVEIEKSKIVTEDLQGKMENLRCKLKGKEKYIKKMSKNMEKSINKEVLVKNNINDFTKMKSELENENNNLKSNLKELKEKVSFDERKIEELNKKIETLEEDKKNLSSKYTAVKYEYEVNTSKLKENINKLEEQLGKEKDKHKSISLNLEEGLKLERKRYEEQIKSLTEKLNEKVKYEKNKNIFQKFFK